MQIRIAVSDQHDGIQSVPAPTSDSRTISYLFGYLRDELAGSPADWSGGQNQRTQRFIVARSTSVIVSTQCIGGFAGWSFAGLLIFVTVWTIMMVAMMLPAAAPMILIFASAQARRDRHVAVPTWIFVAGYILVWAAAGLGAYVLDQAFTKLVNSQASLDPGTWAPLALGITLILAGLYQFTPLKHVCLRQCRSPWGFVAQYWREGRTGAVNMGVRHGLYCLGCCWALFAVLTAVGMMSIAWMLSLTLVVFAEKVFPYGVRISAAVGVALIAIGLLIASGALQLPWRA